MSYLSIDLDYWDNLEVFLKNGMPFIKKAMKRTDNIMVVQQHHQLLDHINDCKPHTVYNIDWHSDLCDFLKHEIDDELDEGTWGNYISSKHKATFVWHFPKIKCDDREFPGGRCDIHKDPFIKPECCGWKKAKKNLGLPDIKNISIKGLGISLSPDWLFDLRQLAAAELFFNRFGLLPYEPSNCIKEYFCPKTLLYLNGRVKVKNNK